MSRDSGNGLKIAAVDRKGGWLVNDQTTLILRRVKTEEEGSSCDLPVSLAALRFLAGFLQVCLQVALAPSGTLLFGGVQSPRDLLVYRTISTNVLSMARPAIPYYPHYKSQRYILHSKTILKWRKIFQL